MGTSADLAVRYRGRTYFQHTSYDGHTDNLISSVASTLAACGIKALQDRMAAQGDPPDPENPSYEDIYIDRREMGNAYLAACRVRNKTPVLLDEAMTYEYGNPDVSHGGLISLFAPQIDWSAGFCEGIEDCSIVLDLDKEAIIVPAWNKEIQPGSYDAGTMPVNWEIPFASIDDLDPEILLHVLQEEEFDEENIDPTHIPNVLDRVRNREVIMPAPSRYDPYRPGMILDREEFSPSIHVLTGLSGPEGHEPFMGAAVDFLRGLAGKLPVFGAERTIVFHPDQEDPRAVALVVDLRQGDDSRAQSVVGEMFRSLARSTGMFYQMHAENGGMTISSSGMSSSASMGFDDSKWDEGLIPADAKPAGLAARKAQILDDAMAGDKSAADQALIRAITSFDEETWRKLAGNPAIDDLAPEHMASIAAHAVFMCQQFERGVPGSTASRFEELSPGRRSALLEAMTPIDRHMFAQLVKNPQASDSSRPPKP